MLLKMILAVRVVVMIWKVITMMAVFFLPALHSPYNSQWSPSKLQPIKLILIFISGYNIEHNYKPYISSDELHDTVQETCQQFFIRNFFITQCALQVDIFFSTISRLNKININSKKFKDRIGISFRIKVLIIQTLFPIKSTETRYKLLRLS